MKRMLRPATSRRRGAVATLRQIDPKFTLTNAPEQLPFKNKADQERFLSAFRADDRIDGGLCQPR
jgi:hypothetical protein